MEKKKYTYKDYLKIAVIGCIIGVPLFIAYYGAGFFEEGGTIFWSHWNCDKMVEFAQNPDFNRLSEEQHKLYNMDMAPCIEEP